MPVEVTYAGSNVQLSIYPVTPWGWSTSAAAPYSGSTSANGVSTHSTMSYYVWPMYFANNIAFSRIDLIGGVTTGAAGTGSATVRNYIGLYRATSDSLTLITSWMAGFLYSQNSATAITMSVYTGSDSATIARISGNSSANVTGQRLFPMAQGTISTVSSGQYFGVFGMHSITNGIAPVSPVSIGVEANNYVQLGNDPVSTSNWAPLNGAFTSTSSKSAAGSAQWLMPSVVANAAITGTRPAEQLRPPVMMRGI